MNKLFIMLKSSKVSRFELIRIAFVKGSHEFFLKHQLPLASLLWLRHHILPLMLCWVIFEGKRTSKRIRLVQFDLCLEVLEGEMVKQLIGWWEFLLIFNGYGHP